MALTPGVRLGPYEIVSALGAGGMGDLMRDQLGARCMWGRCAAFG